MGLEHCDRLATLNEKCLILLEVLQTLKRCLKRIPGSSGSSRTPIHDQMIRVFGYLSIQNIVKHPVGPFDLPALAVQLRASYGGDRPSVFQH